MNVTGLNQYTRKDNRTLCNYRRISAMLWKIRILTSILRQKIENKVNNLQEEQNKLVFWKNLLCLETNRKKTWKIFEHINGYHSPNQHIWWSTKTQIIECIR